MRAFLNALYTVAGWLAALCLVAIAVLVGLQVLGRIADGLMRLAGYPPYGFLVAGLAEIAGYLLAIASLFALAPTLRAGAHVRVIILLSALSEPIRRIFEMGVLAFAAVFSAYMTWHIGRLAYDSWQFNEVSYGLVPLPLAWPLQASGHDLGWLAVLGVFQLAIPCLLAVRLARVLPAAEVALLGLLEVVFGVAWAWLGAGEAPNVHVLCGGALVLLALAGNEALGLRRVRQGR